MDHVSRYLNIFAARRLSLKRSQPIARIVATDVRTVTKHRPDREPKLYTKSDTIAAEPHLPGFSCRVGEFFR